MDKIIGTLIFTLFFGCATTKKQETEVYMDADTRKALFSHQNFRDRLVSTKDPIYFYSEQDACFRDWPKKVFKYKKQLRNQKIKSKMNIYFKLGNCYSYIKDFEKAIYYYDMVEASGVKDSKILSVIQYNIGQMYEHRKQYDIAKSYYLNSYRMDEPLSMALFRLSLLELNDYEFGKSLNYLKTLEGRYRQSDIVKFLKGVNYFYLKDISSLKNKVLLQLDDKFEGKVLLEMAKNVLLNKDLKSVKEDLSKLELKNPICKSFQDFLSTEVGK